MAEYVVKSGDTLGAIAKSLGVDDWRDLYVNGTPAGETDPRALPIGATITTEEGEGDGGSDDGGEPKPGAEQPEALPAGVKLVKMGNRYRAVWDLGDNLGWAWYDISPEQLDNVYDTKTPAPHFTVANEGQFEAKFGNNYWGNASEINLKAETPWEDLKERIFNQFGYVPGFDEPEIRRLLIQAFYEDWNQNQWLAQYRNTDYYNQTTAQERKWAGLSEAEKNQAVESQAYALLADYQRMWGTPLEAGNEAIQEAAFRIASGQMTYDEWEFETKRAAASEEGTPEWRRVQDELEAQREHGNEIENLTSFAEAQWRAWVGPAAIPTSFASRWGQQLASGEASEADLQQYLKDIANGRWQFKPENVTWEDWAAPYKQEIRETLELGSLDDSDPLLKNILNQDLTGVDLDQVIRQDRRFRSTRRMYGELANRAEEVGRMFGFVS